MEIYLLRDFSDQTTEQDLEDAFAEFGSVVSVKIQPASFNPPHRIAIIKMAEVYGKKTDRNRAQESPRGRLRLVKPVPGRTVKGGVGAQIPLEGRESTFLRVLRRFLRFLGPSRGS